MNSYDSAKQNCQLCYQIYARDLLMFNQTLIDKPAPFPPGFDATANTNKFQHIPKW